MTKTTYGGQAVIEGVMMAGPKGKAIAVRNESGEIIYKIEDKKALSERHKWLKWPLIRGLISFCNSMVSGIKDLTWSAAQAGEAEDEKLSFWEIAGAVIMSLIFAIAIFVVIPVFAATYAHQYIGDFGRSLFEGLLRIGLFLGYILLISRMNDIKRVFAYHGAEHKTINAYEQGAVLTPENISGFSRIHTRCGTSFIMMAMLLMIIIFTFVGQTTAVHRILIKIVLLPAIAGLSYELFRLPLKYPENKLVRALVAPGLALQRLTTREPDLSQIEVALAALRAVPGFAGSEIDESRCPLRVVDPLTDAADVTLVLEPEHSGVPHQPHEETIVAIRKEKPQEAQHTLELAAAQPPTPEEAPPTLAEPVPAAAEGEAPPAPVERAASVIAAAAVLTFPEQAQPPAAEVTPAPEPAHINALHQPEAEETAAGGAERRPAAVGLGEALADISDAAQALAVKISAAARRGGEKLAAGTKRFARKAEPQLRRTGDKVAKGAKQLGGKLAENAKQLGGKLAETAKELGGKASESAKELGGKVGESAKELGGKVGESAKELGGKASQIMSQAEDKLDQLRRQEDTTDEQKKNQKY